jgi:sec-independent protein translocase protein TatB
VLGLSFTEILVIAIVALLAVGPQKLPGLLRTLGMWARKLRIMSSEMRAQSGIDDILRSEGLHGGITELRSLMRGQANLITSAVTSLPAVRKPIEAAPAPAESPAPAEAEPAEEDPYENLDVDTVRESPPEGPDSYGAIPDDLLDDGTVEPEPIAAAPPAAPDETVPSIAEAAPSIAEAAPPIAEVAPPIAEAAPSIAEAAPPIAEVAPPIAEAAPPIAEPVVAEPEVAPAPLVGEPPAPEAQTTSHER